MCRARKTKGGEYKGRQGEVGTEKYVESNGKDGQEDIARHQHCRFRAVDSSFIPWSCIPSFWTKCPLFVIFQKKQNSW